eukprot:TRINITY_DN8151_c0_g1_i2.p1 TRINITY_DN8151_c0_g1~~TRINITY_DN8151_c0_g1_i2.p1  ORF type:complete len:330 (-),score=53.22 TRINITY_DN8151_c0_g1_i2:3-992(-)
MVSNSALWTDNHYNTIGNLLLDARTGLAFPHFGTGSVLQLSGKMSVEFTATSKRMVLTVEAWTWLPRQLAVTFDPPANPRELNVVAVQDESDEVRSIYLQPTDREPLGSFRAGQYLPIEVDTPQGTVSRTYSLSCDPSMAFYSHDRAAYYRISVKRQGAASSALHQLKRGSVLRASAAPMGEFVLHSDSRAAASVLIGAGVGITPLLSMAHELLASAHEAPVLLIHTVQDEEHRIFKEELAALSKQHPRLLVLQTLSRSTSEVLKDGKGVPAGRLDGEKLEHMLAEAGVDVSVEGVHSYICGPAGFMGSMLAALEGLGSLSERVHYETF